MSDEWAKLAVDDDEEERGEAEEDEEEEEEDEEMPAPPPARRGRKRKSRGDDEEDRMRYASEIAHMARERKRKEVLDRRKLINNIKRWANPKSGFPDVADPIINGRDIEKMKMSELDTLLLEIQTSVGNKTSSMVSGQMSVGAVAMAQEALSEYTPLQVAGPKVKLVDIMQTKDAQDLTKELALTFAQEIYVSPLWRCAAFLTNAVTQIHGINSSNESGPQPAANKPQQTGPAPAGDGKHDTHGFEMPVPPPTQPK